MDAQHDATDAANGLFMLAKGGQATSFPAPQPPQPPMQTRSQGGQRMSNASTDNADSVDDEDTKPPRGKRSVKGITAATGRRKSDMPAKGGSKRQKSNGGAALDPALGSEVDMNDDDSDMDDDMDEDIKNGKTLNGKKMTDEEKRKNFLERNRYVDGTRDHDVCLY